MRLGRLFARCACVPALTMAHNQMDHVRLISQKEDSRDAKARLLDALDASSSRGKERCILRAAHPRARVRVSEGSHQVASRKATNVDFPGSESDDLRAVARATHVEGRTHGDARGRQSATCAAVGAERATGFQERVRPVALERLGGCRIPKLFFTRSLGRSRSEPSGRFRRFRYTGSKVRNARPEVCCRGCRL